MVVPESVAMYQGCARRAIALSDGFIELLEEALKRAMDERYGR